ncbi:RNA dependent RNA polymerase-domain-containing protein [Mycena haematopus]|nr:RNA dependent RNA polymerase-domain-containing protein [Mycena haematopus]
MGDHSPATPSRPPRGKTGHPGSTSKISRTFADSMKIEDDHELPLPQLLFGLGPKQVAVDPLGPKKRGADVEAESDVDTAEVLQDPPLPGSVFSAMGPPEMPRPRPLQQSATQTSIDSTSSFNSLFSAISRTSSTSSVGSIDLGPRTSPLKRGAELQDVSPSSPSKCRKLSENQNATPQSRTLAEPPIIEHLQSTNTTSSTSKTQPSGSFSLGALFGGQHGTALETYIIAHSTEVQKLYDRGEVALGVQWELSRGVSTGKWTWEEIKAQIKHFSRTTNSEVAWKIPDIMRGRSVGESRDLALWNEVDREHKAIQEGKSRGLGLVDEPWEHWDGQTSYYGGQIEYPLRLKKSDDPERQYEIYLEKPRKGRSHRFARDLGSPSILHLSVPSRLVRDEGDSVRRFLAQRFILNGRVYIPIPPKDTTSVYLIQTDQNYERKALAWYGDKLRLSFDQFVQRHNPPGPNSQQPFAKYTARFALGLSTSIPVLEFEKENIFYISDIIADGWDPNKKPPADKIMTDGCGWMNHSALLLITRRVGYASLPTAVQGRIGGAKGLWTLHPDDADEKPKIWIRDSQLKIKLSGDLRVHRIFDLLRPSRPSQTESRERLSEQSILCLSHNGIPDDVLVSLLVKGLEATVNPLLIWAPGAMVSLWRAIDRTGNVSGTRVQRIAASKSRVLGFRDREPDEVEGQVEAAGMDTTAAISNRPGRDNAGGPLSLHEQAMELIQAGFHPATCAYLNDKLRLIIKNEIKTVVEKYRISLPESTASQAFVIPDPLGVLKENEIFYRSSNPMKNPTTQTLFQTLKGPVLVSFLSLFRIFTEYPMRLPCDVQMVTAVYIPALHDWPDVIIASTAGQQSLLSLLSGGDTVVFIWLDEFLKDFGQNQPLTPAPNGLMLNFDQEVKTVEQVGHELCGLSPEGSQRAFQGYLLNGLCDSKVGLYSYFHDNAIWRYGYGHPNSILMAYMGNTLLDAGKTGLSLKSEVLEEHKKAFNHDPPRTKNWTGPPRHTSKPFILQTLSEAGTAKGDELLAAHDRASGKLAENYREFKKDEDLLKPYKRMQARAQDPAEWSAIYKSELGKIERHMRDEVYEAYRQIYPLKSEDKVKRAEFVLTAQEKYAEPTPDIQLIYGEELEQVKASYAYSMAREDFGFTVAFRTLCSIKAQAGPGGIAPNSRLFDELKSISGSASQATLDEDDDDI